MTTQPLSQEQIAQLSARGCSAEDWNKVYVSPLFDTAKVRYTAFYGHVELGENTHYPETIPAEEQGISYTTLKNVSIGDNCAINHVGIISNYRIGNNVRICRVQELVANENFDLWEEGITVGNEAGEPNIYFSPEQNEQEDWLKLHHPTVRSIFQKNSVSSQTRKKNSSFCLIEDGTRITNSGVLHNLRINEMATINGASDLQNGYLERKCHIGSQVIAHTFRIGYDSQITEGANLHHTIVGDFCRIGKGFTAENCYISHHCELFCGEACAVFAGPHTVSHHKSSLLIGGEYSFYNAGSGTNQSNHAYKMGPIHYGTLGRGSKTASGCHILWPMQTAPFTMIMGKISTHPRLENLPFSYLIAEHNKTHLIPGINLCTIGTYRDIIKWKERGCSKQAERIAKEKASYDFLSPYIMQKVFAGKEILEQLRNKYDPETSEYPYENCTISKSALEKGIGYYKLAIRLYAKKLSLNPTLTPITKNIGEEWFDMAGIPVPTKLFQETIQQTKEKSTEETSKIIGQFILQAQENYATYALSWGLAKLSEIERLYPEEFKSIQEESKNALNDWKTYLTNDAKKEHKLGDVTEETLGNFIRKIEAITADIL